MMATLCVHRPAPWNLGLGSSSEPRADPCRDLFSRPCFVFHGFSEMPASANAEILIIVQPIRHLMWVRKKQLTRLAFYTVVQRCGTPLLKKP